MNKLIAVLAAVLCGGCSSSNAPATADARPDLWPVDGATGQDRGASPADAIRREGPRDAAPGDTAGDAATQPGLPFSFVRPPEGTPVPAAELAAITDKYIDLLVKTRYFDFVDERVHGWPQSDPQQRYWYGTWWSGVGLHKSGGQVTFLHVNVGADNNGLRTGPVLEGMCFAAKLWSAPKLEHLTRRLIRGFHSWILAMQRQPNDPAGTLLARVSYPQSITATDGGRSYHIDYEQNRPGIDSYVDYVHIPANPHWGDIWIKNKRSKDDIGHMLRAIASLSDCSAVLSAATAADRLAMQASYVQWAKRVEADGWAIASYDKSGKLWLPPLSSTMSRFIAVGNAECNGMLAVRLYGQGNPGTFNCGNGIHPLEWIALQNDQNGEIVRSFHEAAVKHALLTKHYPVAQAMLPGLAQRIAEGLAQAEAGKFPVHLTAESLADLMVHSANAGVPLTWREVRWLHKQIEQAHTSYVSDTPATVYRVFDPGTPDGDYEYAPNGKGLAFNSLALLVGTCVATYRNPTSMPVLDCARLQSWLP